MTWYVDLESDPEGTILDPQCIHYNKEFCTIYNMTSLSRIPKSDPMEGRLQDMLRYNMEKHAGQPIDTLATSRRYSSN